ncbi:hypothetical protein CGCVW01_v004430, partial [Colletotrichum viniferum]
LLSHYLALDQRPHRISILDGNRALALAHTTRYLWAPGDLALRNNPVKQNVIFPFGTWGLEVAPFDTPPIDLPKSLLSGSFGLDRLSSLFYYFRPKQGPLIISLNSFFRLKISFF